jgi:uncharacterized membrane protein HdeD (DUF308 family)
MRSYITTRVSTDPAASAIGAGLLLVLLRMLELPAPALTGLLLIAFGATLVLQRLAERSEQGWLLISLQSLVYALLGIIMLGALVDHAETVAERLSLLVDVALALLLAPALWKRLCAPLDVR